jgi:hypothetical protein
MQRSDSTAAEYGDGEELDTGSGPAAPAPGGDTSLRVELVALHGVSRAVIGAMGGCSRDRGALTPRTYEQQLIFTGLGPANHGRTHR